MPTSTEQTAKHLAESLTDELTADEKARIWDHVQEKARSHSSDQPRGMGARRHVRSRRGRGSVAGAASVVAGLAFACVAALLVFVHPEARVQLSVTQGSSPVTIWEPSWMLAHVNWLYIGVSVVVFVGCVWILAGLVVPRGRASTGRANSGQASTAWNSTGRATMGRRVRVPIPAWVSKVEGTRRWIVAAVLAVLLVASGLEVVDQAQGGPLGREYPFRGATDGMTMHTGQTMLLIPTPLADRTFLPLHILGLQATSDVRGLSIEGGIVKNPPALGGMVYPSPAQEKFLTGAVTIPSHSTYVHGDHFVPVFKVTGNEPGFYAIDGFTVIYSWGPFVYNTKVPLVWYHITVRN